MIIPNSNKTIVTFQGGSAGDMFTKSCNGEHIELMTKVNTTTEATLKNYEQKLKEGKDINLNDELQNLNYSYVSTHLFEEIINKQYPIVSIVVTDPEVQLTMIYRQLQVQRLRMKIDEHDNWYVTTRDLCLHGDYESAAHYWFNNNKDYWLRRMKVRLETNIPHLNFNKLFNIEFTESLYQQGWTHNLDLLYSNHSNWLLKNSEFSLEKTISSISKKLSAMDWKLKEGWVWYTQ